MDLELVFKQIYDMREEERKYYEVIIDYQEEGCLSADCRLKTAEWFYKVADSLELNREIVSIAMKYLDRYLCSSKKKKSNRSFQLAAVASFSAAMKVNDDLAVDPSLVCAEICCRGRYTARQIKLMEHSILNECGYATTPPTETSFLSAFMDLMILPLERTEVMRVAEEQIEVAVSRRTFMTTKPSLIAAAALMNVLECYTEDINETQKVLKHAKELLAAAGITECEEINAVQTKLYDSFCVSNNNDSKKRRRKIKPPSLRDLVFA